MQRSGNKDANRLYHPTLRMRNSRYYDKDFMAVFRPDVRGVKLRTGELTPNNRGMAHLYPW